MERACVIERGMSDPSVMMEEEACKGIMGAVKASFVGIHLGHS